MSEKLVVKFSETLDGLESEGKFSSLVKLGRDALECLDADNNSCMIYLERMARVMVRLIYRRYNLFVDSANITQKNLQNLNDLGIINQKTLTRFKTLLVTHDDDNAKRAIQIMIPLCNQLRKIYNSDFDFVGEKFPAEIVAHLKEAESKMYSDSVSFFVNLENACEGAVNFIVAHKKIRLPASNDIREKYVNSLKALLREKVIREQGYSVLCDVKEARNNFAHIGTGDFMLEDKGKANLMQRVKSLFKFFTGLLTVSSDKKNQNKGAHVSSQIQVHDSKTQILRLKTSGILEGDKIESESAPEIEDSLEIYETGDLQEIQEKINSGADVNERSSLGNTPLMHAAKRNAPYVVKFLLESGADVNAKNKKAWTALLFAAAYNTGDVVELLLESGANVNAKNKKDKTAIICALESSSAENIHDVVRILVEHGADEHAVASNGRLAADFLGKVRDLKFEAISDEDFVELCKSASMRQIYDAIRHGANINARTKDNSSALMFAARFNHPGIVEYLIANGADVNLENDNGNVAMDFARTNENMRDSIALKNLAYKTEREFLRICKSGTLGQIQDFVEHDANVNARAKDKSSALMFAARFSTPDVIDYLLSNAADANLENAKGNIALDFARVNKNLQNSPALKNLAYKTEREFLKICKSGTLKQISEFIENGANVNARAKDKSSALMFAARFNSPDAIKYLLSNGADVNLKNTKGNIALDFAKVNPKINALDLQILFKN